MLSKLLISNFMLPSFTTQPPTFSFLLHISRDILHFFLVTLGIVSLIFFLLFNIFLKKFLVLDSNNLFFCLQELGAHGTMDRHSGESTCYVYRGRFGPDLQHSWRQGVLTQWWLQEGCPISSGISYNGRSRSLSQPGKAR